jgi:hypothetical protein
MGAWTWPMVCKGKGWCGWRRASAVSPPQYWFVHAKQLIRKDRHYQFRLLGAREGRMVRYWLPGPARAGQTRFVRSPGVPGQPPYSPGQKRPRTGSAALRRSWPCTASRPPGLVKL